MTTAKELREQSAKGILAPPRTVTLPATAFATSWLNRPHGPMTVGLRRLSADELLAAEVKGRGRAQEIFPHASPFDPARIETAEIVRFHFILGKALCDPHDYRKNLWLDQQELASPNMLPVGPSKMVEPMRFTRDGLHRLFDELEILAIEGNPTWPEATDDELEDLGASLLDGSFIDDMEDVVDPGATEEDFRMHLDEFERDLRRFLKHIIEMRRNGPRTSMTAAVDTNH